MKHLFPFLLFLLHDFLLLCSFLISHPLIPTYLLLLFPHLLKLISLLHPLLLSTSLLLLSTSSPSTTSSALLNFLFPQLIPDEESKACFIDQLYATVFIEENKAENLILQRDGSRRKEKEWKRTLACKLFEERMTHKLCEGAEEMDLLWEAYEKQGRKEEKVEDDEMDLERGMSGKLCCLQAALKLSAGKMNLGVGRPSLVKVSMALKGLSVFRRAGRRRKVAC